MAIKDWPLPIRRAIGWLLLVLAFTVAFAPLALVGLAARADEPFSWVRLLGGYAFVVTVPITLVVAAFVAIQQRRDKRGFPFFFAVLLGTTVGLFVGLILGLVTGGYSLLYAPATGLLTFVVAWLFRRPESGNKNSP